MKLVFKRTLNYLINFAYFFKPTQITSLIEAIVNVLFQIFIHLWFN